MWPEQQECIRATAGNASHLPPKAPQLAPKAVPPRSYHYRGPDTEGNTSMPDNDDSNQELLDRVAQLESQMFDLTCAVEHLAERLNNLETQASPDQTTIGQVAGQVEALLSAVTGAPSPAQVSVKQRHLRLVK